MSWPTRRIVSLGLIASGCGLAIGALARPGPALPEGLTEAGRAHVAKVRSGNFLELSDGRVATLAAIQAPKNRSENISKAWPLASEAEQALAELVLGKQVELWLTPDPRDRWGRLFAHLVVEQDGEPRWVQGELLMKGFARVATQPRTAVGARKMLDLERRARANRRGIWSNPFYRIRNPGETVRDFHSAQIVEGRVVDAAKVKGVHYLNFGEDWRKDFTFRVQSGEAAKRFRKAGVQLTELTGRRVRGRGWIFSSGGPMIDLTHPEQLEIFED